MDSGTLATTKDPKSKSCYSLNGHVWFSRTCQDMASLGPWPQETEIQELQDTPKEKVYGSREPVKTWNLGPERKP